MGGDEKAVALGVDLGGTKLAVAVVDVEGKVLHRLRRATDVGGGAEAVRRQIVEAARELQRRCRGRRWTGVGLGVAGQIDPKGGRVRFAPNLGWEDVSLGVELQEELSLPVMVTNDVRAATLGEWLFGAGRDCPDLVCLFVGTGIGGGVVSGGAILSGCSNTAAELGHITVDIHGPPCRCGNRGCLEALAGGWAIAERARREAAEDPEHAAALLQLAGGHAERITTALVAERFHQGDPLAGRLFDAASEALIAGATSLVNAFNPCRLILGGGVMGGMPQLVARIEEGVRQRALSAATACLKVLPAGLGDRAGMVGAGALALGLGQGGVPDGGFS
jgi:glucokinase